MVRYRKANQGRGGTARGGEKKKKEEKHGGRMSIKFEELVEAEAIGRSAVGPDEKLRAEPTGALAIIVPTAIVRRAAASAMLDRQEQARLGGDPLA